MQSPQGMRNIVETLKLSIELGSIIAGKYSAMELLRKLKEREEEEITERGGCAVCSI